LAKTLLDLDERLLAEAATALGTRTKRETVEQALERVIEQARARRQGALEDLQQMASAGLLDFDALDELDR